MIGHGISESCDSTGPSRNRDSRVCAKLLILSGRPDPSTPLRAVVNLAGISPRKSIEDYTLADVDALLPVNVKGPIFVTQAFLPGLRKRAGGGVVVQHRPR